MGAEPFAPKIPFKSHMKYLYLKGKTAQSFHKTNAQTNYISNKF